MLRPATPCAPCETRVLYPRIENRRRVRTSRAGRILVLLSPKTAYVLDPSLLVAAVHSSTVLKLLRGSSDSTPLVAP